MDNTVTIVLVAKKQCPLGAIRDTGIRGAGVVRAWVLKLVEHKLPGFGVHGVFKLVRRVRRAARLGVEVVIVVITVLLVVTALGVVLALLALEKIYLGSKQVDFLVVRK
jgi:hypothetical protein